MALCHKEVRAHVECTNPFPSFGRFEWVPGPFWANKKAVLWRKMRSFAKAPLDLAPLPQCATVGFQLKTWIWQRHHLGFRMASVE